MDGSWLGYRFDTERETPKKIYNCWVDEASALQDMVCSVTLATSLIWKDATRSYPAFKKPTATKTNSKILDIVCSTDFNG